MNRLVAVVILSGALLMSAIVSQTVVHAQTALSDEHLETIRQNCVSAQATLYQLHASDALLRVNRGKLYENISTKLMAQLNSRIALNKHEGLKLAATTLEYDRQIDIFRADYRAYEESMSQTLDSNCTDKPAEFYESMVSTREKRQRLHEDTKTLTTLLNAYKAEFEEFAQKLGSETK